MFSFQIKSNCSNTKGRAGIFNTPHGSILTPTFMPVGTLGTVKGLSSKQIADTGAQIVLSNTYHLHLQPGEEIVSNAGGLHEFINWDGPILTDSGGFQVFSLAKLNQIDDLGVSFTSPRDGSNIHLTPEKAIQIQMNLGADIIMAFDHCPEHSSNESRVAEACKRTHNWLERCIDAHTRSDQALFGIVQGGCFPRLRKECVDFVTSFNLPGFAIGGVSVGEPVQEIHSIVRQVTPLLPEKKPKYLMGIGTLREMSIAIANGVDLFDCVIPTRLGRHGAALIRDERWNLKNARFRNDFQPLDKTCTCETCTHYTRAYLHHLIRSGELLGLTLLSLHNLSHLLRFTKSIRQAILDGCFSEDFTPWIKSSEAHHTW